MSEDDAGSRTSEFRTKDPGAWAVNSVSHSCFSILLGGYDISARILADAVAVTPDIERRENWNVVIVANGLHGHVLAADDRVLLQPLTDDAKE